MNLAKCLKMIKNNDGVGLGGLGFGYGYVMFDEDISIWRRR